MFPLPVNVIYIFLRLFQFFVLNDSVLISLVELPLEVGFNSRNENFTQEHF